MGREEIEIIAPVIEALRAEGLGVTGPHSADTMFHAAARATYDAAVAMYHDQALIPIKTLAFDEGVNVTLGLPFVRTSPDHGTAFDIRGQGPRQSRQPDRRAGHGRRHGRRACRQAMSATAPFHPGKKLPPEAPAPMRGFMPRDGASPLAGTDP